MRILVINNIRGTEANPKSGSYVSNIGECLVDAGFDVEYLLPRTTGTNVFTKIVAYFRFYARVMCFRFSGYDLIYLNFYPLLAIPLLIRFNVLRRSIIHWHGEDLLPFSKFKAMLFKPFIRLVPRETAHIVPSNYFKTHLQRYFPDTNIMVSPSGGVDLKKFSPLRTKSHSIRIGYASGLDLRKGLEDIKRVVEQIKLLENEAGCGIEIHYIDYGRFKGTLEGFGKSTNNKLIKWEIMPNSKMPKFFNALDILLFPTRRKSESLGLVPLEAMACGVAVVATDDYACPEYVIPGVSGEVFDPSIPGDIITALTKCIGRLELYRPRKLIEDRYCRELVIEQYRENIPKIAKNFGT